MTPKKLFWQLFLSYIFIAFFSLGVVLIFENITFGIVCVSAVTATISWLLSRKISHFRRLDTMRSEFVANVSHELKTPITSIQGFAETLLESTLEDKESAKKFLTIIHTQSCRLSSILADLLSLSKIEKGEEKNEITLTLSPVQGILKSAVELCQLTAQKKQIILHMSYPDQLEARINAPLLEQAVVNLIDNAIKYSPIGGEVDISGLDTGYGVNISVKDTGPGIAPEHQGRIFERFYRADQARSRSLGGTGLGLSIVKHIALAHHGSVSVNSTLGKGSTFTLTLPRAS